MVGRPLPSSSLPEFNIRCPVMAGDRVMLDNVLISE